MPDLEFADLDGRSGSAFVSVSPENTHVGISKEANKRLGAKHKDRLLLAFDEQKRPWVGVLQVPTPNSDGATIYVSDSGSAKCSSQALQAKLRRFVEGEDRTRLYFGPETETAEVAGCRVEMHRLLAPKTE